jgi:hypothetical protein
MSPRRPLRSVGTTVLSDRFRQPARQFPPDATQSLGDIRAVEDGQARRVICYLRRPEQRWHPFWQGQLLISPAGPAWRAVACRRPRDLSAARLLTVREAEWSDGGPCKPHLFSLVRCDTPREWLELMIPTADVPLVLWSLGAGELAMAHASGPAAAQRASRLVSRGERRWRLITAGSCWLLAAALISTGHSGPYLVLPLVTGAFLTSGLFGQWLRRR